jgi:hypothetical protein
MWVFKFILYIKHSKVRQDTLPYLFYYIIALLPMHFRRSVVAHGVLWQCFEKTYFRDIDTPF